MNASLWLRDENSGFSVFVGNSKGGLLVFAAPMEERFEANLNLPVVSEMSLITDHLISALEKSITFCYVNNGNSDQPK
jgi:hypothetical protein